MDYRRRNGPIPARTPRRSHREGDRDAPTRAPSREQGPGRGRPELDRRLASGLHVHGERRPPSQAEGIGSSARTVTRNPAAARARRRHAAARRQPSRGRGPPRSRRLDGCVARVPDRDLVVARDCRDVRGDLRGVAAERRTVIRPPRRSSRLRPPDARGRRTWPCRRGMLARGGAKMIVADPSAPGNSDSDAGSTRTQPATPTTSMSKRSTMEPVLRTRMVVLTTDPGSTLRSVRRARRWLPSGCSLRGTRRRAKRLAEPPIRRRTNESRGPASIGGRCAPR
jgi:hypothetical protein